MEGREEKRTRKKAHKHKQYSVELHDCTFFTPCAIDTVLRVAVMRATTMTMTVCAMPLRVWIQLFFLYRFSRHIRKHIHRGAINVYKMREAYINAMIDTWQGTTRATHCSRDGTKDQYTTIISTNTITIDIIISFSRRIRKMPTLKFSNSSNYNNKNNNNNNRNKDERKKNYTAHGKHNNALSNCLRPMTSNGVCT